LPKEDDDVLTERILTAALCLESPWYVASAEACQATRRLHVGLRLREDGDMTCPQCGTVSPVDLTWPRIWLHDAFFGYRTYLLARLPDLGCEACGIVPAAVSWESAGFALLTRCAALPGLAEWCAAGPLLAPDRFRHGRKCDDVQSLPSRGE
jgi:hypothetical protein